MAAALKRLRDALELQQFIQDAEDVSFVLSASYFSQKC